MSKAHYAQVRSYLKATGLKVALLVNFGKEKADFRRVESNPKTISLSPILTLIVANREKPPKGGRLATEIALRRKARQIKAKRQKGGVWDGSGQAFARPIFAPKMVISDFGDSAAREALCHKASQERKVAGVGMR